MSTYAFDPERASQLILLLAYERGRIGSTFATAYEYRTPGYSEAWERGYRAAEEERANAEAKNVHLG
jgi:hypothetical protein